MTAVVSGAPLVAHGVVYRAGARELVRDVTMELRCGEVLGIVGPNGAGKSTLLRLLAGDLRPSRGRVTLDGQDLARWPAGALALRRAVLPQQTVLQFAFTARQVVAMGRAPHRTPDAVDQPLVASALEATDAAHLAGRAYPSLSGGEQARVSLARVLVQEAPVVLLDEPTAALDIRHQAIVMERARRLAGAGAAVLAILHDLNLAARWCDRIGLMADGRLVACDVPQAVLEPDLLQAAFGHPIRVHRHPDDPARLLILPE